MTNEQINIAIAEACGWKHIAFNRGWIKVGDGETQCDIPNYCKDLNAMNEAEKMLLKLDNSCGYWETYSNALAAKLGCTDIFHATARQRAETFLKTIGKWEGAK